MNSPGQSSPRHGRPAEEQTTASGQNGAISGYFLRAARDAADRPLVTSETSSLTYGAACLLAARLAKSFVDHGFEPGDRALICMPNGAFFPVLCNAIWLAGGVVVVTSPLDPEAVLAFKISDCSPRFLFILDDPDIVAKVDAANTGDVETIALDRTNPLRIFDSLQPTLDTAVLPDVSPDCLAILQYTGGTTGAPKAAMLSHANLTANVAQCQHMLALGYGEERFLAAAPFSHITGLNIMILACSVAAEITIIDRFDPAAAVALITTRRLTYVIGVPTMFHAMLRTDMGTRDDWRGCKYFISGGAPIPEDLAARFYRATGHQLLAAYGLSETSPGVSMARLGASQPVGSSGCPLAETEIDIRSVDDPSRSMPIGDTGEICVRGPQVMQGYWRKPEESRSALVDGWLRTGDIGRLDRDGYLYVVDRLKDIIIASGHNIYPAQVEEAIYFHPDILEVAVVGEPDAYRGETVRAVAVLRPGATLTIAGLRAFLKDRLSPIEMPKILTIAEELPKSPAGKILRRALRTD